MKPFRILVIFILVLFLMPGCTSKLDQVSPPPADLIPRDVMIDVLVDFHLYDAVLQSSTKRGDENKDYKKYFLYTSIVEKYNITREQFENSILYYQQDIEVMDAIYAEVITKLSKMKSEAEKQ